MVRSRFRSVIDLKRSILNSLLKHGPTTLMILMYEAEVNHREFKRLIVELIDADLVYMTTSDKIKVKLTEEQSKQFLWRWRKQRIFIITEKGKKCVRLMNQPIFQIHEPTTTTTTTK